MSDFGNAYPLRTVCEVTREIMDIIIEARAGIGETVFNEIESRLQEQMVMQKKMDAKLKEYNANWAWGVWKINADFEADEKRREGR